MSKMSESYLDKVYSMMRKEFEETYNDPNIVDRALELYGNKNLMGCKEEFNGVSLTNVLDLIRNKSNEYGLLIAVVGDKVEDTLLVEGSIDSISLKSYISQGTCDFVEKWKKEAKILNYHNHPNRISARPSIPDIENFVSDDSVIDEIQNIDLYAAISMNNNLDCYSSLCLDETGFDDWGVVTEFDFFSYKQKKDEVGSIFKENYELLNHSLSSTEE